MTSTTAMQAVEVSFSKQFNGYDKDEVDRYIRNLSEAYQTAYEEYTAVCAKYNSLVENCKTHEGEQEHNKSNIAVIAKTLVDAETLAAKIMTDAREEADKIMAEAQTAAQIIKDKAHIENTTVKMQSQKIIDDANAEATVVKEHARELIDDAQIDAAQIEMRAKKNLSQANEKISQLISDMQKLLT